MFVHWGVYSVVGGQYKGQDLPNSAEWMMARGEIPIVEYQKYAEQFNPVKFDADEFVARAKRAGMKYIVITAKNYDGFAMFGSNVLRLQRGRQNSVRPGHHEGTCRCVCQARNQAWVLLLPGTGLASSGGFGNDWDKTIKHVNSDEYVMNKAQEKFNTREDGTIHGLRTTLTPFLASF